MNDIMRYRGLKIILQRIPKIARTLAVLKGTTTSSTTSVHFYLYVLYAQLAYHKANKKHYLIPAKRACTVLTLIAQSQSYKKTPLSIWRQVKKYSTAKNVNILFLGPPLVTEIR